MIKQCLIFLLAAAILPAGQAFSQEPAASLPAFRFFKLDNTPFANSNLPRNKKMFFIFFDAGCEHCQRAVAYLDAHTPALQHIAMYMVTLDSRDKIDRFLDTYGPRLRKLKNLLVLQDREYQFITRFKPRKYPSMMLYSPQGKLLHYDDNDQAAPVFLKLIEGK